MFSRTQNLVVALLVGCLTLAPAVSLAQVSVGSVLGTTLLDVLTGLEGEGYTVVELELNRDHIEAKAILDNRKYEIEVDLQTGKVREIELD